MISLTTNHGFPYLVGDILLSSTDSDGNIETPSFLSGTGNLFDHVDGLKPFKFTRKVYIINDQLCVGLGGNYAQMYSFLNSLQAHFKDKIPSVNELKDYLNWYDVEKMDNLFGIVLLAETINTQIVFHPATIGKLNDYQHPVFEKVIVGGSGSNDFKESLNTFDRVYGEGAVNNENKALSQTFMLLSIFLGHEVASAKSLMNKWGAGFELITYKDGKFIFIDNFTFIFWKGVYNKDLGLKSSPFRVMKYKYEEDVLIIRATDFEKNEKAFGVIPLNKDKKDYKLDAITIPDYHSKSIIVFYILRLENGQYITPSMSLYSEDLGHVFLRMNEGYLEVAISENLTSYIENILEGMTSN